MLDIKNKILSICSAGQTQPIHYIAATGEAKLVETEGDSFPLGILDDPDYQETNIELKAGDKIMFYTDGIVEAMNAKEEMFGFERLLEIMQQAGDKDATTLLNETIDSVNAFAGNVAQHDDLTIIVLGVAE
jgi:serine phosphatase RsbU (regulator of sigma subunit)